MSAQATGRMVQILHLEDNDLDGELVQAVLEEALSPCRIQRVETRESFQSALGRGGFDLVISDYTLPSFDGKSALAMARELCPDLPFLFFSGSIGEDMAIESLRAGATDYVLKQRPDRLVAAAQRAIVEAQERLQRREAEERLFRSEERFRAFMEYSPLAAFIKEADGRYVYVNRRMEQWFGQPEAGMNGRTDFDFMPPEAALQAQQEDARVFAGQQAAESLHSCVFADGKRHSLLVSRFVLLDTDGARLLGGVAIDITNRLQNEQKLREQAAMLDKAQDAICVIDLEQHILYWNDSAERLYGWMAAECLGEPVPEWLFANKLEFVPATLEEVLRGGEWSGEVRQHTREGKDLLVQSRWTLLRNEHGDANSVLVINSDITEKKAMEAQLLRAQRMEGIGALAGGIAHDLNNVLAPIMMATELLRGETQDPFMLELANTIKTSAERGAGMVQQILSFARGLGSEHTVLDLKHLFKGMLALAKSSFPKSIRIEGVIANDIASIRGDATQLHQILLNLCINARDAMPGGGSLRVVMENTVLKETINAELAGLRPGPYVLLKVTDTGSGIPPEVLPRIFDPFFSTKKVGEGTGLGLSTVSGIIKSHGGGIYVESVMGQGTTFFVYLPAVKSSEGSLPEFHPAELPMGEEQVVLLVEDEAAILELNKTTLENYNYRVMSARNGAEALQLYREHQEEISLVMTDLMMPVMDGAALIQELRRVNPEVKLVFLSGLASQEPLEQARTLGAKGVLHKPYSTEELLQVVAKAIKG